MTKDEYLRLIQQFLDQQYADEKEIVAEEDHWIPAESPLKDKIPIARQSGIIDLTNAKRDRIAYAIVNASGLRVDNFLIKSHRKQHNTLSPIPTWDVTLLEEVTKTPSGNPCRMTYSLDVKKDTRFASCPWIDKFQNKSSANVDQNTLVDIVRWLQAIKRLTVFL